MNNAKGGKEVIRLSYQKHLPQAQAGKISTNAPHHYCGLYGVLGGWKKSRGIPLIEAAIWGELAPFLAMSEKDSVEALAEYTISLNRSKYRKQPNIHLLNTLNNNALHTAPDEIRRLAIIGFIHRVKWLRFLDNNITEDLRREAQGIIIIKPSQYLNKRNYHHLADKPTGDKTKRDFLTS